MSWKLVDRYEIDGVRHLLGVSPWPLERCDLFKPRREQGLGCSEKHPPRRARINGPSPLECLRFLRGIITRQRLNYLVPVSVVWQASFMIEHKFCMAADILKILAMGKPSSWAGHRASVPSECCGTVSDTASFQRGGPDPRITFHKNRMLHLPVISWTFILLQGATRDQVNTDSLYERGTNSLPRRNTKTLCLSPPEV